VASTFVHGALAAALCGGGATVIGGKARFDVVGLGTVW
jgi:hypothetical protein